MSKIIKSKKLKALIILIAAAIIVFAAVSVAWVVYYNTYFKPLVKNFDINDDNVSSYYSDEDRTTWYEIEFEKQLLGHTLIEPRFLGFNGKLMSSTGTIYDPKTGECLTDYAYYLDYCPGIFKKNIYEFRIEDNTIGDPSATVDGEQFHIESEPITYRVDVDKDMNFVSGDRAAYDEHYNELKELFDNVKEFFGEDAFK